MKKIFILPFTLLFLSACEKTALTGESDSVKRPVVEAYLSPGQIPAVKVTYQLAFASTDTVIHPIEGLIVLIESDGMDHPLTYSVADSLYRADGSWQVEAGKTYRLHFDYNGGTITAESTIPQKPEDFAASAGSITLPQFSQGSGAPPGFPDPIELGWNNSDGAYYLVVVENLETNPVAIFEDNGNMNRPPRQTFRSEPEQTDNFQIGLQNFQYFGTHRVILFRLNAEYASLYDDNGNSSQNLTSPYSNVAGGFGIFTGLNSDTLMVEVNQ